MQRPEMKVENSDEILAPFMPVCEAAAAHTSHTSHMGVQWLQDSSLVCAVSPGEKFSWLLTSMQLS